MDRAEIARLAKRVGRYIALGFLHALRLGLGGVFIYAGVRKVVDAQGFAHGIQNYGLIASADVILMLAIYLPWLEIAAGLALILQRLKLGALAVMAVLLLIFMGALGSAWIRGLDISCGCFAEERTPGHTQFLELLGRDAALLLVAAVLLRIEWRKGRVEAKL